MKIQFLIRLYRQNGYSGLIDFAILARNTEFDDCRAAKEIVGAPIETALDRSRFICYTGRTGVGLE